MADYPKWHSADFSKLVPAEVQSVIDGTVDVINTIQPILELISDMLGALAKFLTGAFADFIQAVIDEIENIKNTYLGAGYYHLPLWDHALLQVEKGWTTKKGVLTFDPLLCEPVEFRSFMSKMARAFDDIADEERPLFKGNTRAFVLVVAASSVEEFVALYNSLASLLPTDRELQRIKDRLTGIVSPAVALTYKTPYDWNNYSNKDLIYAISPELSDIIDRVFATIIAILAAGKDAAGALADVVKLVKKKVDKLNSILEQAETLLTTLSKTLLASGLHCLYIESSDGVDGVKQALMNSKDIPFDSRVFVSGGMWLCGPVESALMDLTLGQV
jgi:hypothetical protein